MRELLRNVLAVVGVGLVAALLLGVSVGNDANGPMLDDARGLRIVGVPTGSLVACGASTQGLVQFDTTTSQLKLCNSSAGTQWVSVLGTSAGGYASAASLYLPAAAGVGNPISDVWPHHVAGGVSAVTAEISNLYIVNPGTGGGNFTVELHASGGSTITTTGNIACTAARGYTGATAALSAASTTRAIDARFASNGCTTLPDITVSAAIKVTP